jgi:hypothetical protein
MPVLPNPRVDTLAASLLNHLDALPQTHGFHCPTLLLLRIPIPLAVFSRFALHYAPDGPGHSVGPLPRQIDLV